jgi:cytochrome c oxidase subunit IV
MAHSHDHHGHQEQVIAPANTKIIWRTFWILLLITLFEFVVAFMVPHEYKWLRIAIFVGMTIVKAAYIIGEFMHLRHEVKTMIWTILLPVIFVVWLIISMIYEGGLLYAYDRA